MTQYIGCDAHRRYSQMAVMEEGGRLVEQRRVNHEPEALADFFGEFEPGTPVALETAGHWYWLADLIEAAGCECRLTHAQRAKVMMGHIDKSDKLDAKGLAKLLCCGTLPTVYIPSREGRDQRALLRWRMDLTGQRTQLKNRVQAVLGQYGLTVGASDAFGQGGRRELAELAAELPPRTRACWLAAQELLDQVERQIQAVERQIEEQFGDDELVKLLKSLPGVGPVLAAVIAAEVVDIARFPRPERFASYCGLTPKEHSSGGHTRRGHVRAEANRHLKWAFREAAEVIVRFHEHERWRDKELVQEYERLAARRGSQTAKVAIARRLAEAAWWILTKREPYREKRARLVSPRPA